MFGNSSSLFLFFQRFLWKGTAKRTFNFKFDDLRSYEIIPCDIENLRNYRMRIPVNGKGVLVFHDNPTKEIKPSTIKCQVLFE